MTIMTIHPQQRSNTLLFLLYLLFEICVGDDSQEQEGGELFIRDRLVTKQIQMGSTPTLLSAVSISLLSILTIWGCRRKSTTTIAEQADIKTEFEGNNSERNDRIHLGIVSPVFDNTQWVDMKGDTYIPEVDHEVNSYKSSQLKESVRLRGGTSSREHLSVLEKIDEES